MDTNRGVTPVVSVIILVAVTTILAAVVGAYVYGPGGDLQEPSLAAISVTETTIDPGPDEPNACGTGREVGFSVTLTYLQQADIIYVIANEEGAKQKKVIWDDPTSANVGETKILANTTTGSSSIWG